MQLINWIGRRVTQPGDSETFFAQKILSVGMIFGGCVLTLISALMHKLVGFKLAPLVFVALGIVLLVSGMALLWKPGLFRLLAILTLSVTILANVAGQLLTGGLASGTYDIVWSFVAILGAVLIAGRGETVMMIALFALGVAAGIYLNPAVQQLALEAPITSRMAIGTYNLVLLGIYLAVSTMLLIRVIDTLRIRADELLLNILPAPIAARLKEKPETIADGFSDASVLFADIVDFTSMSANVDPVDVVNLLNAVFSEFDGLARKHGLEKIKTIGDAYMVASGLPEPRADHVEAIVDFAVDMLVAVEQFKGVNGEPVNLRVGINTGPVVAGVIGRQKFIYDLWGDAVNVASRMESNGLVNQIQVTEAVKDKLDGRYKFIEREPIPIKGQGMMVTYLLEPS